MRKFWSLIWSTLQRATRIAYAIEAPSSLKQKSVNYHLLINKKGVGQCDNTIALYQRAHLQCVFNNTSTTRKKKSTEEVEKRYCSMTSKRDDRWPCRPYSTNHWWASPAYAIMCIKCCLFIISACICVFQFSHWNNQNIGSTVRESSTILLFFYFAGWL